MESTVRQLWKPILSGEQEIVHQVQRNDAGVLICFQAGLSNECETELTA